MGPVARLLTAVSLMLVGPALVTGCGTAPESATPPGISESPSTHRAQHQPNRHTGDCISPFAFDGRQYSLAMGSNVKEVDPGEPLGEGTYATCEDADSGTDGEQMAPRPVYAFPGVPPEQAILLTNSQGAGSVLIADAKPANGWDHDLEDWITQHGILDAG